ncbi:MAG: photosystem II protein Psb27 [Cyanobacteria bacterium LVE1205-1]|jgi:photosystem II Psb27 protein
MIIAQIISMGASFLRVYLSKVFVLVLVLVVSLSTLGCTANNSPLSGNYGQDTLAVVQALRSAINTPDDSPDKSAAQTSARLLINEFASLYRRDDSLTKLVSYTTMRTALNGLAGHYSSYPNRPVPQKLKDWLEQEFKIVEAAINRGA